MAGDHAGADPVTLIYRPDDFPPDFLATALERVTAACSPCAAAAGFQFRCVPLSELVPTCVDGPRLWWRGADLLATPQCFQVDDFSSDPQAHHFLQAVQATIEESHCVLLNRAAAGQAGPADLTTDKLRIVQRAHRLGVRVPPTVAVPYGRHARQVLPVVQRQLGPGPYIVKPRELGMGFAVLKVDTAGQLSAAVDLVAQTGTGYLVQPYLPNEGDVRVYVVAGEVIAGQHRTPAEGNYLANISQGASSRVATDDDTVAASRRLAEHLHAPCLSVDWLITADGPVLIEWSFGIGGFGGLPEPARSRVGSAMFAWARARLDERTGIR